RSAAHTFTGTYDTQYKVTFNQTGIGNDTGSNNVVTIAGTPTPAGSLPDFRWVTDGQTISFAFQSPVASSDSGKQYVLSNNPNSSSPYTVNGAAHTVTATYTTQYQMPFTQTGIG